MRSPFLLPPPLLRGSSSRTVVVCAQGLPRVPTLTRSSKIRSHGLLAPLILPVSTGSHSSDLGAQGDPVPSGYIVLRGSRHQSGWTMRSRSKVYGRINQQLGRGSEITVWYDRLFHDSMLSTRNCPYPIDVHHAKIYIHELDHESVLRSISWRMKKCELNVIMKNERCVERCIS